MSKWIKAALAVFAIALCVRAITVEAQTKNYGIGETATKAEIAAWNDDVNGLTGKGLPPGSGSVAQGQALYEEKCAVCHGDFGEGAGRYPVLAGGQGSLTSARPIKTVGSYWPYAPTLFDYVRRAMPFNAPGSLTNHQVYAIVAYVLNLNNIVPSNAVLDAKTLAAIKMPNRNGFINEHLKPDVHAVACMHNCKKKPVKITSNLAATLGITPSETTDTPQETIPTGTAPEDAAAPSSGGTSMSSSASAKSVAVQSVPFSKVQSIIAQRCEVCHAQHPKEPGYTDAPLGIMLDTPARIKAQAQKIKEQAVDSHQMPLANMTHMTEAERKILGEWISEGAKIN